jgi:hypothetical protein
MYTFSVGALFKNEAHCIREWIRHYIFHGAEHFYLINDGSTDDFMTQLKGYEDKVTVFTVNEPYYLGRQRNLYNRYLLPRLCETAWLLVVDLDEFVWSPMDVDLRNILRICNGLGQIQVHERMFGSNGHETQPKSLVESFTRRAVSQDSRKYFVHNTHSFTSLNVHHADFVQEKDIRDASKCMLIDEGYFVYNHYKCQSREFWNTVKCVRGDSDSFLTKRPDDFSIFDLNEVEDLGLWEQNRLALDSNIS